jgi:RimJ/RimL family protein N-acetyltransferase
VNIRCPLPVETGRLRLRRFEEGDAPAFHAYRNDPRIARYQSWTSCTLEEAGTFVRHHRAQAFGVPGEWLQVAVALKETNELVGDCGVRILTDSPSQATFGVTFARQHHRRGLVVEAVACLFDTLFSSTELERVVADTDPENTAAWRLAERLGMRREGHRRRTNTSTRSCARSGWAGRPTAGWVRRIPAPPRRDRARRS